ncbi:LptF/LptG family permease [Aureimonas glaciei]|jgi:lipopolysaccharide export system permease protein|uniref:LPS export ABC transporter permease LptF n=1 Tax=Aureimonas glaciei TaxID=1776957 RepID=A0A917D9N4_9HYPH|nr:LptF/LptG family permease [Aureimonas glaciei]GGD14601.1 LPS export ABC transporter permease LptF [Aureimonas glaciei]
MSLLERYIFKRALGFSLASLMSLVLIVWVVQALQRIDIVRTSASAAGNIFWIALMLVPDLAAGVVPFAIIIGAIQALNALNADSERAVIAASGASSAVVVKPILALGMVAALLLLVLSHVVGPAAQRGFYNGLRTINADAITLFLQPGRFVEIQDGLIISIGAVNGSTVDSLFLSDLRDPTADLTYFAKQAQILQRDQASYLLLIDGQLHRKTVADGATSIIQFQTYAFDLASLKPEGSDDWVRTSERPTGELLFPDLNDPDYQSKPASFTKELAQRFSDWLYPIAFALWALVVAGHPRTNRQGAGPAMVLGLSGALVLKALGFVSLSLVDRNVQLQLVVYLVPLASIAFSILLLYANVNVSDLSLVRRTGDAVRAIAQSGAALWPGASPAGGKAGRR